MTLLEELAVHAPKEVPEWFEPQMRSYPKLPPELKWCEGCKAGGDCDKNADCEKMQAILDHQRMWKDDANQERIMQWPWAYASLVMSRKPTAGSEV